MDSCLWNESDLCDTAPKEGPETASASAVVVTLATASSSASSLFGLAAVSVVVAAMLSLLLLGVAVLVLRKHAAVAATLRYWRALWFYWVDKGTFSQCSLFQDSPHANVHVFSLALIMELWASPHYRTGTFQQDMLTNLRNVALPGTGVPLSWLCHSRLLAQLFLVALYPLVCLAAAIVDAARSKAIHVSAAYVDRLLTPTDWFSLWRLNCRLASYHALRTGAAGFAQENKWTFLQTAAARGISIAPFLDVEGICVKDMNEEGGMGIHFFRSATHGGKWIIQHSLKNAEQVQKLLPDNAPLSTVRVITASRGCMDPSILQAKGALEASSEAISVLSCVFRAGFANASTDHQSVLFDVDPTGVIGRGTTNQHWYKLGMSHVGRPGRPIFTQEHPDRPGVTVSGNSLPFGNDLRRIAVEAHRKCIPDVPLAGWDIALTPEGPQILEANLSCNFFCGTIDWDAYLSFLQDTLVFLETAKSASTADNQS